MPTDLSYHLLRLVQRCKEHQTLEQIYRAFITAVLHQHPELGFVLDDELKKIRPSIQATNDAEYHELEAAILDETDVLNALKRFLYP